MSEISRPETRQLNPYSQLIEAVAQQARTTEIAPLYEGLADGVLAVNAVRSYLVNPLSVASQLIDSLPPQQARLNTPNLNATYQRLAGENNPTYNTFLQFVGDQASSEDTTQDSHQEAFFYLANLSLSQIAYEIGTFLTAQFLRDPDNDLAQIEQDLEGIFDFVLSREARPFAHAAMQLEREARETEHYSLGRVIEKVYKNPDPTYPEALQPHFTRDNQDAMLVLELPTANGESVVFMVGADGITNSGIDKEGIGTSQEIARAATIMLAREVQKMTEITPEQLYNAFKKINLILFEQTMNQRDRYVTVQDVDEEGHVRELTHLPSATLFAALLFPDRALWASVGDSYIEYAHGRKLHRLNIPDFDNSTGSIIMSLGLPSDYFDVGIENLLEQKMQTGDQITLHSDGIRPEIVEAMWDDLHSRKNLPPVPPQIQSRIALDIQRNTRHMPFQVQTIAGINGYLIPALELHDDALLATAVRK